MYHEAGFDKTVDVIVVGFGDAGAVAAMTAHDAGAEVLIIEKQRADARRPNSRFSGGLFISPGDVDAAEHYMLQLYRINDDMYETDPALIREHLPEPLEPLEQPLVHYEWIKMPVSSGFGSYTESGMVIPARLRGEERECIHM